MNAKKSTLLIITASCAAALLLVAAAAKARGAMQPNPYAAVSWLASVLSFGVFAVMMSQYATHGRRTHLYLGAGFLALGVMYVWDALSLPGALARPYNRIFYVALWQAEWITLFLTLCLSLIVNRGLFARRYTGIGTGSVIAAGVLWGAFAVFLTSYSEPVARSLSGERAWVITSLICATAFTLSWFAISRPQIHRGNAVLSWMATGLIFAAFAQIAFMLRPGPWNISNFWFGLSGVLRLLVLFAPLAGMLAEHTRLQAQFKEQTAELANLVQAQNAAASNEAPAEIYRQIAELSSISLSSSAAFLMPFDKERSLLFMAAGVGFNEEDAKRLIFRPGEGPAGEAFFAKRLVAVMDVSTEPALMRKLDGAAGIVSAVFAPLMARGECLGVLGAFFNRKTRLSKSETRLFEALAGQAALALETAQMRERLFGSARSKKDYALDLETVTDIARAVTSKLDLNGLVDTLTEKLKAAVDAKACSVLVLEAGEAEQMKILGTRRLIRRQSIADHIDACDSIALSAAQAGEAIIMNGVSNSCHCKYPELVLEDGGTHHLISVPMAMPGFLGAINIFRQNAEPFGEREKALLTKLAPMVAVGIRNAGLYERQKTVAESLQKSFLPDLKKAAFSAVQVDYCYQAAFDESLVGGDFYDVTDLGGRRYGIAIGDVSGKGIEAAVYTAMARHTIKAYSAEDLDPLSVVQRLNGTLCRYTPSSKFITLVYGVLDANTGTFTYVNAGHELPLLYRSNNGAIESLETGGPAAGAVLEAEYEAKTVSVLPGDLLIFYTDGATEARREGKFLGTEGLKEIVADLLSKETPDIPQALLSGIGDFTGGTLRDDIAIICVKLREPDSLF
ncbi:MAG: SpoIIE family protein phosphatase [Armatimonadota bacterium]